MNQNNNKMTQPDQWLGHVLKAEQTILDGHMPPIEQLLSIPADIRMKSPILLRAECEYGLLSGRLMETKQMLEAALRGFAAQADESAMLTMMAMLGLLYVQVGDKQESKPFIALLSQEWERNPENCSGFVPWALARASANKDGKATAFEDAQALFMASAERFREEGRPLWTSFVLLDRLLFDSREQSHPDWQFWLNWLKRHTSENPSAAAVANLLVSQEPSAALCDQLPARFAYLSKAVLLKQPEEQLPAELADDIESAAYAAGASIKRQLAEGLHAEAAESLLLLNRQRRLVSTPEIERLAFDLQTQLASASAAKPAIVYRIEQEELASQAKAQQRRAAVAVQEKKTRAMEAGPAGLAEKWRVKLIDGISFSTADGRNAEPIWKRRKAGELFVYLLMQPGYRANREQVVDKVFGEGDPAKRSNQLYVTLHDLRNSLKEISGQEDPVFAKRGIIGISELVFESVDIEEFITLSRVGDQLWMDDREAAGRLYDKALPLYGQLGTELPHAEWLERLREQLLDRQTNMLKRLASFYIEQQDEARVEQRLADWIELRPVQEEAYEAMIRLCLRGDRRIEAIGWYRRLERVCKDQLGSEPLDEVRKLLWH
ncbi:BTAD domain-containing putative transcriptional regulator [Paenibacillus sp. R14(2021)]|uniref:AfsR/SARP family transcriptional regulator n=1 Tax=Paenibacillus sp. R14(2021) TaxID=2859228 RepID=UPI001C613E20|nr:BTAD domain-containing putative transcriptional regulator [Paenibacillus sp. R14(2021)]